MQNVSLNSAKEWLSYDVVRFKIELGLKRNSNAKMQQNRRNMAICPCNE